jgi:FixJ family two-component response regulator
MTSRAPGLARVDGYTPSAQSPPKSGSSVPERARTDEPIVYVVDDEMSIRNSTKELAESVGLRVQTFATAQDFLQTERPDVPGCLVLDVRLPGLSGFDLQRELCKSKNPLPVIFVTGHGDIPMSVKAMKAGAIDFLAKPYRHQDLLDAITQAIERDRLARKQRSELLEVRSHYETLTPREREVMSFLVKGFLNKQVAAELGMTVPTVKFHRAHLLEKMKAESIAELVRMSERLEARGDEESAT